MHKILPQIDRTPQQVYADVAWRPSAPYRHVTPSAGGQPRRVKPRGGNQGEGVSLQGGVNPEGGILHDYDDDADVTPWGSPDFGQKSIWFYRFFFGLHQNFCFCLRKELPRERTVDYNKQQRSFLLLAFYRKELCTLERSQLFLRGFVQDHNVQLMRVKVCTKCYNLLLQV